MGADDPTDRADRTTLDESWDEPEPRPDVKAQPANDQTIAGLGVTTPRPSPFALQQPVERHAPIGQPRTPAEPELVHPERSPLSFVMHASETSAPPRAQESSHDMSVFVAALVADTSPVVELAEGTAMAPVMRRSRKRRRWLAASAIAATVVLGTALGMHFAGGDNAPRTAASEANQPPPPMELTTTPPATAPTAPTPPPPTTTPGEEVAAAPTANAPTDNAPTVPEVAPTPDDVAPSVPPTTTVAMSSTTAKSTSAKQTTAPHATTKKPAAKKKIVAKKVSTAKKATKPSSTKVATVKKKPVQKSPAKPSATSTTAKKTKKKSRS